MAESVEPRFVFSERDLVDLRVSPELRAHMGLVMYRVRKMIPVVYREIERSLSTPRERLVEMARAAGNPMPDRFMTFSPP